MSTRNPAAERLARLRQSAINLPTVGFGSPLVLALGAAEAAAQALNLNLKQMGVLGGVAAGAIAVVAVELIKFNKGLNDSKKALENALTAQDRYYQALGRLSAQSAQDQIADYQRTNNALMRQIEETRAAAEAAFSGAQQAFTVDGRQVTAGGDFLARVATAASGNQLNLQLEELNKQYQANENTVARLTQGLEAGSFAAELMTEKEQQLADARRQASQQVIDFVKSDLVAQGQLRARANEMTAEQRAAEVERLGESINSYQHYLQSLKDIQATLDPTTVAYAAYQGAIDETIGTITNLTLQQGILNKLVFTYGDYLERISQETELINEQYDNYLEALDLEMAAREKLAEISRQLAELEEETAARRAQAEEDRAERITDTEADAADRRAKVIEDALDRIRKIERDYGRARTDAIRNRDVGALIKAKETAADQLEDQRIAQTKQLKSVEEALEKQRRTIERQYEKQQESINRAYQKRYEQLQYQQQREQVALQNAINAQLAIAINGSGGLVQIQMNYWAAASAAAHQGMGSVVGAIIDGFNRAVAGIGGGAAPIGPGGIGGIFGNQMRAVANREARYVLAQVLS